jgi:hypothetical protein
MALFTLVESTAAPAAPERGRGLRCPSCCTKVELADLVPGDWRILHRCGDHVIEAAARVAGALSAWRWRALEV